MIYIFIEAVPNFWWCYQNSAQAFLLVLGQPCRSAKKDYWNQSVYKISTVQMLLQLHSPDNLIILIKMKWYLDMCLLHMPLFTQFFQLLIFPYYSSYGFHSWPSHSSYRLVPSGSLNLINFRYVWKNLDFFMVTNPSFATHE